MTPAGRSAGGVRTLTRTLNRRGAALALHVWEGESPRAVVFYVHGIQSHGGWLFETGPALAKRGAALYALDRRGSGQSGGRRGDARDYRVWLGDYAAGLERARSEHPGLPVVIVGQSMGGSLAAGLVCEPAVDYDALVLVAPALAHNHGTRSREEIAELRHGPLGETAPLGLPARAYTRLPRYLEFIESDERALRAVTRGFRAALLDLERDYMASSRFPRTRPCLLMVPEHDAIISAERSRGEYRRLAGAEAPVVTLPSPDHYIEFSDARHALWDLISQFAFNPVTQEIATWTSS